MARLRVCVGFIASMLVWGALPWSTAAQLAGCSNPCPKASPPSPIPLRERLALIALYRSTNGDHWTHRDGWLGPRGTECNWVGVACGTTDTGVGVQVLDLHENNLVGTLPGELANLRYLIWVKLYGNHLMGTIPATLGRLKDLTWLDLSNNQLTGIIPRALIQKWLEGPLNIEADPRLRSDISQVDYESRSTSVLCASSRYILGNDGNVIFYDERCRNAAPGDRTTYCEVKQGTVSSYELAELGQLIDGSRFFSFGPEYFRNLTDSGFENTRITRNGKTHAVSSYADAGPLELWGINRAIWAVVTSAEWQKTSTQPKCPRW